MEDDVIDERDGEIDVIDDDQPAGRLCSLAGLQSDSEEVAKLLEQDERDGEINVIDDDQPGRLCSLTGLQSDLEEVAKLMEQNIYKYLDKNEKMEELEKLADNLEASAQQFKKTAKAVKNKFKCENMKYTIALVVTIVVVLVVIVGAVLMVKFKPWEIVAKKMKGFGKNLQNKISSTLKIDKIKSAFSFNAASANATLANATSANATSGAAKPPQKPP